MKLKYASTDFSDSVRTAYNFTNSFHDILDVTIVGDEEFWQTEGLSLLRPSLLITLR